jgi:hypothetical protein
MRYNDSMNETLPQFDRERHGSLYDRGSADFYYHRNPSPHWWPEGTGEGTPVLCFDLSSAEVAEYLAGYNFAKENGFQKEW